MLVPGMQGSAQAGKQQPPTPTRFTHTRTHLITSRLVGRQSASTLITPPQGRDRAPPMAGPASEPSPHIKAKRPKPLAWALEEELCVHGVNGLRCFGRLEFSAVAVDVACRSGK